MKILVTGGSGFIGTNLCLELRRRGHKVTAVDLLNTDLEEYTRCDVRNYRQIERVFSQLGPFDFVYHLAAEYGRWNGEDFYENLWQTNVIGTKHLLKIQEIQKFKMIFFLFSGSLRRLRRKYVRDVMIDNPVKDTLQMNDYAISKWAGELMCMNAAKMAGAKSFACARLIVTGRTRNTRRIGGLFQNLFISACMVSNDCASRA